MPHRLHHINRIYWWQIFCASLQFISRIPVPQRFTQHITIDDYVKGVIFFPIIGFIIGMSCALVFSLAQCVWGSAIGLLFAVLCNTVITGAFHLDGLADTADGVFTLYQRPKMLEIMRDSRIGTNGVLALFFAITLKIAVLYALSEEHDVSVYTALIGAPVVARTLAVIILMYRQPYARDKGLGHVYIGKVTTKQAKLTLSCGGIIIAIVNGGVGIVCALFTLGFMCCYRAYIQRKLAGQTGDTLGGGIELAELCFCLSLLTPTMSL